jgi:hypothetical protein
VCGAARAASRVHGKERGDVIVLRYFILGALLFEAVFLIVCYSGAA